MAGQSATQQQSSVPSTAPAATDETAGGTHSKETSTVSPPASSGAANNKKTPSSRPSSLTKTSPSPITRKVKNGFWQSLISVLIPCSTSKSASRAHDVEPDVVPADGSKKAKADKEKDKTTAEAGVTSETDTKEKTAAAAASTAAQEAPTTKPAAPINGDAAGPSSESPSTPTKPKVVPPSALAIPDITTTSTPVDDGDLAVVPATPHSHLLPREETEGVTSGAVQAPGSTGDIDADHADADHEPGVVGDIEVEDEDDEEERLIMQGGTGIPIGPDGKPQPLLPPVSAAHKGRKCLVLDLDETLLHSSFKLIPQADYVVPVEIEWQWHNVYVIKRPGVDNFLKKMGELYEVVIFTASLSKYADPVLDRLDVNKVVAHRLFRESCYNHKGNYVKDLSRLGRPIEDTIILDNSPASYIFHPNNAVPVSSWFNDPHDTELTDLCPFLTDLMTVEDVRGVLDGGL